MNAPRRLLNLGLMAILVGLILLGLVMAWPGRHQAAPLPAPGEPQAVAPAAAQRDPFAPPGRPGPQAARQEPLEVLGVVIGPDETLALIRHGAAIRKLRPGERVGRFRLREVRPDRLLLQGLDGEGDREIAVSKTFPPAESRKGVPR